MVDRRGNRTLIKRQLTRVVSVMSGDDSENEMLLEKLPVCPIEDKLPYFTCEQEHKFHNIFTTFDLNRDGAFSAKELKRVMIGLNFSTNDRTCRQMIQLNETYHGSKDMDFQCFLDMLQTLFEEKYLDAKELRVETIADKIATYKEELKNVFRTVDSDNSGMISKAELVALSKGLGKEMTDDEAERFINQADKDNDGQVSLDEFTFIMMKICSFE